MLPTYKCKGIFFSIILVLFVLPAFLVLGDSIINRTSFRLKGIEVKTRSATGTVRVQGRVRGYINGIVDAEIHGIIRGQVHATVSAGGELSEEGGNEDEE